MSKMKFYLPLLCILIGCGEKKADPMSAKSEPTPYMFSVKITQTQELWHVYYTTDGWNTMWTIQSRMPQLYKDNFQEYYTRGMQPARFMFKHMAVVFAKRFTDTAKINEYHDSLRSAFRLQEAMEKAEIDSIKKTKTEIIY